MEDSLEAIQLPTSRTFWSSQAPPLEPFDGNSTQEVVPAITSDEYPLEACSSETFQDLDFPSTGSTCDDQQATIFKVNTPSLDQQANGLFDDTSTGEGGAAEESSLATAQSYCSTDAQDGQGSMNPTAGSESSSQFTWSLPSSPPPYHPQAGEQVGAGDSAHGLVGGFDVPDFFEPLSYTSNALVHPGHGSEIHDLPLLTVPALIRQPRSLRQLGEKDQRAGAAKDSWQSAPSANLSLDQSWRNIFYKESGTQPLGSPCSVISGFTKAAQGPSWEPRIGSEYNMTTTFGPSVESSDPLHARLTQSMSGTYTGPQQAEGGTIIHRRTVPTKRKRSKSSKNSNEVESQRMTHIAVERNRRKQMNEHLAALRALMPGSYVQKGDQASIVGGAIEFVKELEHLLVCLQPQKRRRAYSDLTSPRTPTSRLAMPNPDPQHNNQSMFHAPFSFHSTQSAFMVGTAPLSIDNQPGINVGRALQPQCSYSSAQAMVVVPTGAVMNEAVAVGEAKSEVASVEVRMVGAEQALVKVMAVRRSGQLLRTVVALESLALTVMHANITTVNHTVLYSFQAHAGLLCRLNAQEIAAALHQTFSSLHCLQF